MLYVQMFPLSHIIEVDIKQAVTPEPLLQCCVVHRPCVCDGVELFNNRGRLFITATSSQQDGTTPRDCGCKAVVQLRLTQTSPTVRGRFVFKTRVTVASDNVNRVVQRDCCTEAAHLCCVCQSAPVFLCRVKHLRATHVYIP